MSSLAFLIPISLCLGLVGLLAFRWTLNASQYDDLDGAAERILFDEDEPGQAMGSMEDVSRTDP